jgi:hypothetical protein
MGHVLPSAKYFFATFCFAALTGADGYDCPSFIGLKSYVKI